MIEITDILDVEKHLDGVEAVVFDLDDTLYSEKEYVKSGFHAVAEFLGKTGLEDEMWQVFLRHGKPIDEVLEKYDWGDRKTEVLSIYRFHRPDIHLYRGVEEMLFRIGMNRQIGIITDGRPEGQRAKLKALGLEKYEFIITDELGGIQYRKPNSRAFQMMRDRLQISLSKMVYVGDNISKDFIAPNRLGIKSIWFNNAMGLYYTQSG